MNNRDDPKCAPHPPLRWAGGQRRVAEWIVNHINTHATYVETCCGGASVFWAKPREWSDAEVLNDVDGELINFYSMLHKRGRELATEVDAMPYSRSLFRVLLRCPATDPFKRAVAFWYVNRVGFGGKRKGCSFGLQMERRVNVLPKVILASLDATIERLRGVVFEHLDVAEVIRLYDRRRTLFYVAPPYPDTSQPYVCQFTRKDHERLAMALGGIRGTYILSYNDHRMIRALYRSQHRKTISTRYTIGCNTQSKGNAVGAELLLSNYPLNLGGKR